LKLVSPKGTPIEIATGQMLGFENGPLKPEQHRRNWAPGHLGGIARLDRA
jgi:hypothetical protein